MLTLYVICFNEKKHESVRMNFFLLRSAFAGEPVEDDGSKRKSASGNKMLVLFKKKLKFFFPEPKLDFQI